MLAIPVMAGSTSYALSEARGKKEGLDLKPREGRYFYGVIAASMLIGLCLNFIGVNPRQSGSKGRSLVATGPCRTARRRHSATGPTLRSAMATSAGGVRDE